MSFATEPLKIISRVLPGCVTMIVRGECDLDTAPQFGHAIADQLSNGPSTTLCLDLSGVSFMDSSGLQAMLVGQRMARLLGGELVLTGTSRQVDRLLSVTGVKFATDVRPTASSATA
jgi:anti-anti-sigma factor